MEAWTKETWITKGNTEAIFHHSTSVLRRDIFVPTINLQSAKCSKYIGAIKLDKYIYNNKVSYRGVCFPNLVLLWVTQLLYRFIPLRVSSVSSASSSVLSAFSTASRAIALAASASANNSSAIYTYARL